jgi:hypothetical protein
VNQLTKNMTNDTFPLQLGNVNLPEEMQFQSTELLTERIEMWLRFGLWAL